MKLKKYFIWEKSYWNNKGIEINIRCNPYCYIKPTMNRSYSDFKRRPDFLNEEYKDYMICCEKNIYWLWFTIVLRIEIKENNDYS